MAGPALPGTACGGGGGGGLRCYEGDCSSRRFPPPPEMPSPPSWGEWRPDRGCRFASCTEGSAPVQRSYRTCSEFSACEGLDEKAEVKRECAFISTLGTTKSICSQNCLFGHFSLVSSINDTLEGSVIEVERKQPYLAICRAGSYFYHALFLHKLCEIQVCDRPENDCSRRISVRDFATIRCIRFTEVSHRLNEYLVSLGLGRIGFGLDCPISFIL